VIFTLIASSHDLVDSNGSQLLYRTVLCTPFHSLS